jgi:hypothetical protein
MTGKIIQWINHNQTLLQWLGVVSLITFLLTPLLISLIVVRMPEDYFLTQRDHFREMSRKYPPIVRVILHAGKNAAGVVFLLAGLAMLVLPGQGIITILVSLVLIDFPGKRSLELRIIRQKKVLAAINWMRARAGRPVLKLPQGPQER